HDGIVGADLAGARQRHASFELGPRRYALHVGRGETPNVEGLDEGPLVRIGQRRALAIGEIGAFAHADEQGWLVDLTCAVIGRAHQPRRGAGPGAWPREQGEGDRGAAHHGTAIRYRATTPRIWTVAPFAPIRYNEGMRRVLIGLILVAGVLHFGAAWAQDVKMQRTPFE